MSYPLHLSNNQKTTPTLTPHVDVRRAAHVPAGQHHQVQHVPDDAEGANDGQRHAVRDLAQVLDPWVLVQLSNRKRKGQKFLQHQLSIVPTYPTA